MKSLQGFGFLTITRKLNESVIVDYETSVRIAAIHANRVVLVVRAEKHIPVNRAEVQASIFAEMQATLKELKENQLLQHKLKDFTDDREMDYSTREPRKFVR